MIFTIFSFWNLIIAADRLIPKDLLMDFGSPFIDPQGTDFTIEGFHRIPLFHSSGAKKLNGGIDHLLCFFGGIKFCHGCFPGDPALVLIMCPGGPVNE